MGFVNQIESGKWKAFWREPSGAQRSKTFRTKKEADTFLAQVELAKTSGTYISPHAGRSLVADHAAEWMQTWNTERTTAARDESIMRTHALPKGVAGSSARSTICRCRSGLRACRRRSLGPRSPNASG